MVHNNVSLTISQSEATKVEDEVKRRLLAAKKLSLVVDLDQTIIHATVDPTVAEWQNDKNHPNNTAVKDVRAFQLVDEGPGARNCWYYIKLRPGLHDFLTNVSRLYELHIYTMGTRAYAQNIATIIDPERKIFGDRILSRDESGSLVAKNLQRLFPVDTKMVVIIDDRGDVWNWNENLIKVTPYDFFVGIGDINSSFLPKKPGAKVDSKSEAIVQPGSDGLPESRSVNDGDPRVTANDLEGSSQPASKNVSALDQLVSMGGGDDPVLLQAQTSQQDETVTAQLQNRPLLQKQLKLEAKDAATESSSTEDLGEENPVTKAHENPHKLLRDYDMELFHLERALGRVHTEYFDAYARQIANAHGGRVAELRGSSKRKQSLNDDSDLALVPDIKSIMPRLKLSVLEGVVLVFSGVIPLHLDWQTNDITLWARNFGAKVEREVGRRTTHVVAARNRTAKVKQAARRGKGKIKVVSPAWLMDCIAHWTRADETGYLLNIEESDSASAKGGAGDDDEILSESEDPPSSTESEDDSSRRNENETRRANQKPFLTVAVNDIQDDESDLEGVLPAALEDDQSPVGGTNEDWSAMNDELNEFLASDGEEDSDDVSLASTDSTPASFRGKKRGHEESSDTEDVVRGRKRQALSRGSSLSQIVVTGAAGSVDEATGLPTPDITAGEEGEGDRDGRDERDDEDEADVGDEVDEANEANEANAGDHEDEKGKGDDKDKGDQGKEGDGDIERVGGEEVEPGEADEPDDWDDFAQTLEAELEKEASRDAG